MVGLMRGASTGPPLGAGDAVAGDSAVGVPVAGASVADAEVAAWLGSASGSSSVEAGPAVGSVATAASGAPSLRSWVIPMMATPAMRTTFSSMAALLHGPLATTSPASVRHCLDPVVPA